MAAGALHFQAKWTLDAIVAYMAGHTFKVAFVNSSTTPSNADSNPYFGAGGTQDYSTNQVSGGNFPAGGITLSGFAASVSGAVATLKATNPIQVASNASNPTTARWGVIYDSTSLQVIGNLDLGGVTDLTSGLNWNLNATVTPGLQPMFTFTTS